MRPPRFDDLRPGRRRSFQLSAVAETLCAHTRDEVHQVLAAAEEAVARGRWVAGWVAYEAAPAFDPAMQVINPAASDLADLPLAFFTVHDRRGPADRPAGSLGGAGSLGTAGSPGAAGPPGPAGSPYRLGRWQPTVDAGAYAADVAAVREHIRRGGCYQVNATYRLTAAFDGDAAAFYGDLAGAQHGGYGALVDSGRWVVVSASPELFFQWADGRIRSRPMKGTAPRGRNLDEDRARRSALAASEKDRAENTMIVDMVRNDLGRIAQVGTVRVPALWEPEKYDTVWQLTSTVSAKPRPKVGLVEVFGALFPAASITGAPKVAAMRIIADREPDPRGVYCGAVGFGGPGRHGAPAWTFNVGIRTVLIDRERGIARYGTGGGITWSSTADGEVAEAALKTVVLRSRSTDADLLETLRWDPVDGFRSLDRHLDRLADAGEYFDVPVDPAQVRKALQTAVDAEDAPQRVRLLVGRDGHIRVETAAAPPALQRHVRLTIDTVPVDPADPSLAFKTTDRRTYEAAAARHPGADDVVLVNNRGEITETTIANLAVLRNGRWLTPPLSAGCLPGTRRAALLAAGRIDEHPLTVDDLRRADAVVRFNALRDWEPCALLPSAPTGDRGDVTAAS